MFLLVQVHVYKAFASHLLKSLDPIHSRQGEYNGFDWFMYTNNITIVFFNHKHFDIYLK